MRRGRDLQPAATDAISLTIGNYHDALLNSRKLDKNVYPSAVIRKNILETDPLYLYHPSPRQDLQNPCALTPLSPAHNPVLIENQYLTGVYSAKSPNVISYKIYVCLPHDINHKTTILTFINNHLTQMQSLGLPTSPGGLDALQVEENSTYPVCPELDDEPITNTTEVIPSQLRTCPYSFTLTQPTLSTTAYVLLLLAIRQTRWTTSISKALIPSTIAPPVRQAILQQMPIQSELKQRPLGYPETFASSLA